MDKTFVYDHNGIKYTLMHPPKKGGEGEVFRLSENPALCAKIYYKNVITEEIHDKISSMIDNPPTGDLTEHKKKARSASIAWPVSKLYRLPGGKDFCGFLMPVIDTELFREAHMYYDPEDRKKYLSGSFTWKYLLTTTYNIAYTVSAIHRSGHCIGDMSGSNILVARTAAISIIDCDSFQIENKKTGQKFFTKVATGDYLAPELMGINFRTENIDRYYSDLFSLSILIFKFLMNGVHPFQARGKGVDNYPTTEHKIKNGIFPYLRNSRQIYPPLYAPPYAILSPEIRSLFERCFIKGINKPYMRPDADEWIKILQDELSGLKQCDDNPNHWYSGYLDVCPWCKILKIKKKEYFPYNGPKIVKPKIKVPDVKLSKVKPSFEPSAKKTAQDSGQNNTLRSTPVNQSDYSAINPDIRKTANTPGNPEKTPNNSPIISQNKNKEKIKEIKKDAPGIKEDLKPPDRADTTTEKKDINKETKTDAKTAVQNKIDPIIPKKPEKVILKPEIRPVNINLDYDPDCDVKAEIEIINKNEDPVEITAKAFHKWIILPEKIFTVKERKVIGVTIDRSHFEGILPGIKYKSWIEFKTTAGNEKAEINVSIQKDPELTINPAVRLLFRGIEKTDINRTESIGEDNAQNKTPEVIRTIEIVNSGERTLKGEISSDKRWITAEPKNFSTKTKQEIIIGITPEEMEDKAIQTGKITVKSNGGECEIQVIASLK